MGKLAQVGTVRCRAVWRVKRHGRGRYGRGRYGRVYVGVAKVGTVAMEGTSL